jgi:hypothetical protein
MATYTDPQLTVETLRDKLPKNPTREIDVLRSSSPTGGKYLKKQSSKKAILYKF